MIEVVFCKDCIFREEGYYTDPSKILCRRYPSTVEKRWDEWCGEGTLEEEPEILEYINTPEEEGVLTPESEEIINF